MLARLLDVLFPPVCIACGEDVAGPNAPLLCESCEKSLVPDPQLCCSVCRRRLPFSDDGLPTKKLRCHPTASHIIFSAAAYDHPVVRALIMQLKFKRRVKAAQHLSGLLVEALSQSGVLSNVSVVTPLPLSAARLRSRGFNQSELLSEAVSREFGIPSQMLLRRVKHKMPQSEIAKWDQRRINIADVFAVIPNAFLPQQILAVVDDVWTSGATLTEAIATLKKSGAGEVIGVVVARAGR